MSKDKWKENNLYRELLKSEEGITTLFRKFETGTWIVQFKGDQKIGMVMISADDLQAIHEAPALKVGDGKTPQG